MTKLVITHTHRTTETHFTRLGLRTKRMQPSQQGTDGFSSSPHETQRQESCPRQPPKTCSPETPPASRHLDGVLGVEGGGRVDRGVARRGAGGLVEVVRQKVDDAIARYQVPTRHAAVDVTVAEVEA